MKRRYSLCCCTLFAILLPGALELFSPRCAIAQDRVRPLKIEVGDKAPDFALPAAEGKTVKLSDYAGHGVLIDFYRGYW